MRVLDAKAVAAALPYAELISVLDEAFAENVEVPQRSHFDIPAADGTAATLLLMPAWKSGGDMGVKIATVFPGNAAHGLPAVSASYFLMNGETGTPVAVLDGTELTLRRTAAASALASRYLSREDAHCLLMVGTGNLAPHLVAAHACARPLQRVIVWGRRRAAADKLAETLRGILPDISVAGDLEAATAEADIISCATLSESPLIHGDWLNAGQHLDLVGAFKPDMRETDSAAVMRAAVYVDTRAGAFAEAGEIVQAIADGSIRPEDIRGELRDLALGRAGGRETPEQITLFKSVGTALEDLAAAELALANAA
jgi:ornithine cyclodeaminase